MNEMLDAAQLDALVAKVGGREQALRILSGDMDVLAYTVQPTGGDRRVTIPAQTAFEDRIAAGRYGWRNPALTQAQYPVDPERCGEVEQRLFHFNVSLSSPEAIQRIRDAGYQPAQTVDILAFGAAFPDVQLRHPVIALGSVAEVEGALSVPALWFDGERRTLDLIWYDGDWHRNYRFMGVRPAA